ncbi:MAG: ABC transporter ATP-binding protein [Candidatus Hodarchaeota archaeon]
MTAMSVDGHLKTEEISVVRSGINSDICEGKIEILCKNVSKTFTLGTTEVVALNDVSLCVRQGDYISIMGPSGSGKTTLLNIISALDRPTSGRVCLDGIDITDFPERKLTIFRRDKIGFVFQSFHLIPTLNVLDNVLVPIMPRGIKKQDKQRALELVNTVGLGDRIRHKPGQLSGGERQRVAIARALINDPPIILGDELTGELDTKTGQEIMDMVERLNREYNKTVIVVTHDPKIGARANIEWKMEDGRIVSELTPSFRKGLPPSLSGSPLCLPSEW